MRIIVGLLSLFFSTILLAKTASFECVLQINKNSCWQGYEVTVNLIDTTGLQKTASFTVPADKFFLEQSFACEPSEQFGMNATFSPPIWLGQKDKQYSAQGIWNVPAALDPGSDRWIAQICFPDDFQEVPTPPGDVSDCHCKNATN